MARRVLSARTVIERAEDPAPAGPPPADAPEGPATGPAALTPPERRALWREWRHCEDPVWADRLYDLVAPGYVDWRVPAGFVLLWALAVGLAGLPVDLNPAPDELALRMIALGYDLSEPFEPSGTIAGLLLGAAIGVRLWARRRRYGPVPWAEWLALAVAPYGSTPGRVSRPRGERVWAGLLAVATFVVAGQLLARWVWPALERDVAGLTVLWFVAAGCAVARLQGLLLALPVAAIVGHSLGSYFHDQDLSRHLHGQAETLAVWFLGVGTTTLIGLGASVRRSLPSRGAWVRPHRWLLVWWGRRPPPRDVARALRGLDGEPGNAFREAVAWARARRPDDPALLEQLERGDWARRLACCLALERDDGRAVPVLRRLGERRRVRGRGVAARVEGAFARRLVAELSRETRAARRAPGRLLCPDCDVRASWLPNPLGIPVGRWLGRRHRYVGCRQCGRGRGLVPCERDVVVVLAAGRAARTRVPAGPLIVNWCRTRRPCDFDRVGIVDAEDGEVESFLIQLGNDLDRARRRRYRHLRCLVSPQARLSDNTLELLGRTFGTLERWREGAAPPA